MSELLTAYNMKLCPLICPNANVNWSHYKPQEGIVIVNLQKQPIGSADVVTNNLECADDVTGNITFWNKFVENPDDYIWYNATIEVDENMNVSSIRDVVYDLKELKEKNNEQTI